MKINENDRILFSNVAKKHNLKKEGLLSMLFKRMLKKGISKNKGLSKAIEDGDKALDDLKKASDALKKAGVKPDPIVAKVLKRYNIQE